jgi:hypothetical protein
VIGTIFSVLVSGDGHCLPNSVIVALCQTDFPDGLDTIQHHTVTFLPETIGRSCFNEPFE